MRLPEDAVVVRATGGASAGQSATAPKPRPSPAASVPGLIGLFRDEWDALALETHQLRASLHSARQELAHALYQHDAALRVIARLVRERDAARDAYEARAGAALPASEPAPSSAAAVAGEGGPEKKDQQQPAAKKAKTQGALKQEVVDAFTSLSEELSKGRKKRVPPAGCATAETVKSFKALEGYPHAVHKARAPGVTCVATAPSSSSSNSSSSSLVVSGGSDGDVSLFDAATKTVVATFSHAPSSSAKLPAAKRAVTDVAFVRSALLASAGADGAVRLWRPTKKDSETEGGEFFATDDGEAAASSSSSSWAVCAEAVEASSDTSSSSSVVALAVHPSRDYLATAGADGEWRLYDLEAAKNATSSSSSASTSSRRSSASAAAPSPLSRLVAVPDAASGGYSSAAFHPDGVILGVGTSGGAVRIWDARALRAVAKFEGHLSSATSSGVTGLSFSENGYYLATGAADGVKAWDLRKLKNLASAPGPGGGGGGGGGGEGGESGGGVSRLSFDPSGSLLAVAGLGGVAVLGSRQAWAPLCLFGSGEEKKEVAGGALSVAWSRSGDALFAGGCDNTLRAFGI